MPVYPGALLVARDPQISCGRISGFATYPGGVDLAETALLQVFLFKR